MRGVPPNEGYHGWDIYLQSNLCESLLAAISAVDIPAVPDYAYFQLILTSIQILLFLWGGKNLNCSLKWIEGASLIKTHVNNGIHALVYLDRCANLVTLLTFSIVMKVWTHGVLHNKFCLPSLTQCMTAMQFFHCILLRRSTFANVPTNASDSNTVKQSTVRLLHKNPVIHGISRNAPKKLNIWPK